MTLAYSYIRFSTAEQAKGDSLRRQMERTQEYLSGKDLILDESLTMKDLGVSAFKGVGVLIQMLLEGREEKSGDFEMPIELAVVQAGLKHRVVTDAGNQPSSNPFFLLGGMIHPMLVQHQADEIARMGRSIQVVADVIGALFCQVLGFFEGIAVGDVIRFPKDYDAKLVHVYWP